jgi:hypothetical protein
MKSISRSRAPPMSIAPVMAKQSMALYSATGRLRGLR